MRKIFLALLALLLPAIALAQMGTPQPVLPGVLTLTPQPNCPLGPCFVPSSGGTPLPVAAGASKHIVSSTLTRIANATAYAGTAASPVAVCLFTSVTACAPMTIAVSATAAVNGYATRLVLEKSSTGATGATFLVYLYQAAPTLAGIFDTSVYNVKAADITSGAWLGTWTCSTQQVNTDNSSYECSAQASSGNNSFSVTDSLLRAVLVTTGAYAPASGETFAVIADTLQSAP